MLSSKLCQSALLVGCVSTGVLAGAGANGWACVQYDQPPLSPIRVNFTAGASSDQCMNYRGYSNYAIVTKQGLTCASIDYIELKNSDSGGDICHSEPSFWGTSYVAYLNGTDGDKKVSGSTNTQWHQEGWIDLENQSAGTSICAQEALCVSSRYSWSGTGEFWIIYKPDASAFHERGTVHIGQRPLHINQPDL